MNLQEFKIGEYFYTAGGKWLCIDIGKLSIVAIKACPATQTSYRQEMNEDGSKSLVGPPIKASFSWKDVQDHPWVLGNPTVFDCDSVLGCRLQPFTHVAPLWTEVSS